ncbi:MAG: signal peptidase I [Actinomycetota bacterium]
MVPTRFSTEGLQADWPTQPAGPPPPSASRTAIFRELPFLVFVAFGVALLIKTFLIQAFFIPSASMEPTLHGCPGCAGDRVLVNKLAYRFREPQRGEVIVFIAKHDSEPKSSLRKVYNLFFEGLGVTRPAETDFVKRIIGLPGDRIQVTADGVYIKPPNAPTFRLREPYIFDRAEQGPAQARYVVPEGLYFVMGDNRGNSSDSRSSLGPIKREDIIGRAFVKVWPVPRMGLIQPPCYPQKDPKVSCSEVKTTSPRTAAVPLGAAIILAVLPAVFRRKSGIPSR